MSREFDQIGNFLGKVTDVLGGVVGSFLENPLPTIATIGLTAVGVPPMVANFAGAALRGGSMEDMAINLATSYIGGQLGEAVGGAAFGDLPLEIAPEMASTATQDLIKSVITNASPAALQAAIKGESFSKVLESAVMGGVSGIIGKTIQSELGLDPKQLDDKLIGGAIDSATKAILGGQDIASAVGASLAQTTLGTALGSASAGLKSVMNDLQARSTDYDTYFGQYEDLKTALAADENWLTNQYATLQNLNNTFEAKRTDLLASQEKVQLAKDVLAYSPPYGGTDLGVGNPSMVKLAEKLGDVLYEVPTDDYGGRGYAYVQERYPSGAVKYAAILETPDALISLINPDLSKLQNEIPEYERLSDQLTQEIESYDVVLDRYKNTNDQLEFVVSNLNNINDDINELLVTKDQYIQNVGSLTDQLIQESVTLANEKAEKIAAEAARALDKATVTQEEVSDAFKEASNDKFAFDENDIYYAKQYAATDDNIKNVVENYVDSNFLDRDEIKEVAKSRGYNITDEEADKYVQQGSEAQLRNKLWQEFDKFAVDKYEARDILYNAIFNEFDLSTGYRGALPQVTDELINNLLEQGLTEQDAEDYAKNYFQEQRRALEPKPQPVNEPQDIWPETIPQEEDLGPPISFTPDVTETPEVEDTGEPVIKREEVYPDFFSPPPEPPAEPEAVEPEIGERVPIAAVEDEEAPALTLTPDVESDVPPPSLDGLQDLFAPPQAVVEEPTKAPVTTEEPVALEEPVDLSGLEDYFAPPQAVAEEPAEAPVDLSDLEQLFAPPSTVVEEPTEEPFTVEPAPDLTGLEDLFAPPQAVVEEPAEEGYGFEIPGDQTGTGATSFVDEDGNTFIVDELGNTYLTGSSGEDLMPSTGDFDLGTILPSDDQALIDYNEQAGKDLAKAQDDQAYLDYVEQAGKDLAKAQDEQAYLDYIEQAGQDLAEAQDAFADSGDVLGDLTGGVPGGGGPVSPGGGGKPPAIPPPPSPPPSISQPSAQGLDLMSLLGMLGMMRPAQQAAPADQKEQEEEQEELTPYTSWEELFTPYSDVTYPPQTNRRTR